MDTSKILSNIMEKLEPLVASLGDLAQDFSKPVRAKLLLLVNHVMAQNTEAMEKMKPYAGRTIVFENALWRWPLTVTLAGLFEEKTVEASTSKSDSRALATLDLRVRMKFVSPAALVETLLQGKRPTVEIEGDADLAAAVAWLSQNLKWDIEKDISGIVGDSPVPMIVEQLKAGVEIFRSYLDSVAEWLNQSKK